MIRILQQRVCSAISWLWTLLCNATVGWLLGNGISEITDETAPISACDAVWILLLQMRAEWNQKTGSDADTNISIAINRQANRQTSLSPSTALIGYLCWSHWFYSSECPTTIGEACTKIARLGIVVEQNTCPHWRLMSVPMILFLQASHHNKGRDVYKNFPYNNQIRCQAIYPPLIRK